MTAAPPPPSASAAASRQPGTVPPMRRAPRVAQRYSADDFREELLRVQRRSKALSLASVAAGLMAVAAIVVLAVL